MNSIKSVCSLNNIAVIAGEVAASGAIGYASAAIFTTINPVFGAIHGLTYALAADITKMALNIFAKNMQEETKKIISQGAGVGLATSISIVGLGLSPLAVLALGVSQLAFSLLVGIAIAGVGIGCMQCCPILANKFFGDSSEKSKGNDQVPAATQKVPDAVSVEKTSAKDSANEVAQNVNPIILEGTTSQTPTTNMPTEAIVGAS